MAFREDMAKVAEQTVTEENKESVKKSETYRTLIKVAKIDPVAAIETVWRGGDAKMAA
jgi:hypothetical protein